MAQGATDDPRPTPQPTAPGPGPAEAAQAQGQLIINAQYVKDLSFENPRAPDSLRAQQAQPNVEINVDVKAQNMAPDNYEVVMTIKASAKAQEDALFLIELSYGALVTARNLPPEVLNQLILVEIPRMMFPFARNIVAETTRDGGFPPLMINPIDFGELMRRNVPGGATVPAAASSA